jgi:hypothetical protein
MRVNHLTRKISENTLASIWHARRYEQATTAGKMNPLPESRPAKTAPRLQFSQWFSSPPMLE